MEKNSGGGSFDLIKARLHDTEILILDFSFLMFMTNIRFLDMLADFAVESGKKVVIGSDFLKSYEIVTHSTSDEQRKIADSAKAFVNDLQKKKVLFHDNKRPYTSSLIRDFSLNPNVAIFFAKDSAAEEALRSCSGTKCMVFVWMSDGKVFCEKSSRYVTEVVRKIESSKSDSAYITVPNLPVAGSKVKTRDGTVITLGKMIDKGAEGAVYNTDNPEYVCKIYHQKQMTAGKCTKLKYFEDRQVKYDGICWPEKMVFTEAGYPVGYIMQRAKGRNLADIFDGKEAVLEAYPDWKKIDVIRTAIEIFKKIEYLHLLGIIVGDVRPQNVMIDKDGKTYLIDMDSCQINGFPCAFGDEDYTPAEYQGKSFSSFLRAFNGENFSLCTLCFFILFMGQHPYAQKNGADSISEDIANHAFPYPKEFDGNYSRVPDGDYETIWRWLPDVIRDELYRTFHDDKRTSCLRLICLLEEYEGYLKGRSPYDPDYEIIPESAVVLDPIDIFSGSTAGSGTQVYNPAGYVPPTISAAPRWSFDPSTSAVPSNQAVLSASGVWGSGSIPITRPVSTAVSKPPIMTPPVLPQTEPVNSVSATPSGSNKSGQAGKKVAIAILVVILIVVVLILFFVGANIIDLTIDPVNFLLAKIDSTVFTISQV